MKSVSPILPMILVLCVCVGFLTFKTFQLQAQVNILYAMNQETPNAVPPPSVEHHKDVNVDVVEKELDKVMATNASKKVVVPPPPAPQSVSQSVSQSVPQPVPQATTKAAIIIEEIVPVVEVEVAPSAAPPSVASAVVEDETEKCQVRATKASMKKKVKA